MSAASSVLRQIGRVAETVAPTLGGDAGIALGWAALGAELVADIVDAGKNPWVEIPRLRAVMPEVEAIRLRRQEALDARFGNEG